MIFFFIGDALTDLSKNDDGRPHGLNLCEGEIEGTFNVFCEKCNLYFRVTLNQEPEDKILKCPHCHQKGTLYIALSSGKEDGNHDE